MLANLASVAMGSSIEWIPLLEEIELEFLDSSLEGSHCKVFFFRLNLHIFPTLQFHCFQESPSTHGLKESLILII